MPSPSSETYLQHFTGNDLQVTGKPEEIDENTIAVTLEGQQVKPEFLQACINERSQINISLRRLLNTHYIGLETKNIEFKKDHRRIVVQAELYRIAHHARIDMLPLIQEGMYVARPHHTNGREPVNNDRLRFTLQQGFIRLDENNLDHLPDAENDNETLFTLEGEPGYLEYYPGTSPENIPELMQNRMRQEPGRVDRYSMPIWKTTSDELVQPGGMIDIRFTNITAPFHALDIKLNGGAQRTFVESPSTPFHVSVLNRKDYPREMKTIQATIVDRRHREQILSDEPEIRASSILTESYKTASKIVQRVLQLGGNMPHKRPAGLVVNQVGIERIRTQLDSPWICTQDSLEGENYSTQNRQRELTSSLSAPENPVAKESERSAEIHLMQMAEQHGMDGRGILVCDSFPRHAALDAIDVSQVMQKRNVIEKLLFGRASVNHGEYFSKHDYNSMRNLLANGIDVYWAHPNISHMENDERVMGTLLQLTELNKREDNDEVFTCLAFVPIERRKEFLEGLHMAWYGTARKLDEGSIHFMQEIFPRIKRLGDEANVTLVNQSGGGPNTSTMGMANRLSQENDMLSMGHILGVKKEPANKYLDAIMPFRNNARDLRQGNMAAGVDMVWSIPGGGGTREERGISQTDLAIARKNSYPLVLVNSQYYEHEYRQYLTETAAANLDASVLECISLIDEKDIEAAEEIARQWILNRNVVNMIPDDLRGAYEDAIASHDRNLPEKKQAWQL